MRSLMMLPLLLAAGGAAAAEPAVRTLPWSETAVFRLETTPGRVTDIALEPGEQLLGSGAVAAGDTARWILGLSESGAGAGHRAHVLVKPTASGLATNLVIATDRRTYHLELRSTPAAYAAAVAWRYPAGELVALAAPPVPPVAVTAPACPPAKPEAGISQLNFGWRIEGKAPWKPLRVYDDGRQVVVEFPKGAKVLPPLFEGRGGELRPLDYATEGGRLVTTRLFALGELRLGAGRRTTVVRLVRDAAP